MPVFAPPSQDPAPGPGIDPPRRGRAARLGVGVTEHLVDRIVSGEFPAGSTLPPEPVLGENYGVSRTVIREANKVLETMGLVEVAQGRGTHVNPPEAWNLLDEVVLTAVIRHDRGLEFLDGLIEVRTALECEMAMQAARRATPQDLIRIRAALEAMGATTAEPVHFGDLDVEFHDTIAIASGNRLARAIVGNLHAKARTSHRYHGRIPPDGTELTLAEHEQVVIAIETGDADAAAEAMRLHITRAWMRRRPKA